MLATTHEVRVSMLCKPIPAVGCGGTAVRERATCDDDAYSTGSAPCLQGLAHADAAVQARFGRTVGALEIAP
jgi:hypothetical protein